MMHSLAISPADPHPRRRLDALAPGGEPMGIDAVAGIGPNIADDQAGGVAARCA
jgi:hypothetical protein